MSVIHLNDDDLVLHYYGEMDGETEAGASAHLSACAACRERYAKLQRVLAAVETLPEAAVDEGFERMVWARLEPALDGRKNSGWSRWPTFSPVRLAWAAALVAVVASAFVAGRVWDRPGPEPAAAEASAKDLRERLLLVDLASARTSGEIGSERARAQDLLASTRLYRQTAASAGDTALADLLDEMERVLVDVTAGAAAADPDASRQRVDSLLFKVRVVSSTLRERQKAAFRMRAGQSS